MIEYLKENWPWILIVVLNTIMVDTISSYKWKLWGSEQEVSRLKKQLEKMKGR